MNFRSFLVKPRMELVIAFSAQEIINLMFEVLLLNTFIIIYYDTIFIIIYCSMSGSAL